ncbi:hypothetical protein RGUI_4343 (plasmid) [Rhodovulum sp. P5]|uniref:peptidoglycan-binding domain-containing protein n=1 Tax=Rhodovulum sp. P5 TaxID=1564506 RepID=UPI0009C3B42F|nr:peptidoglycan-binding domain-containing protein [Rhodovulum sp. P5]ARE42369.1 hypothetical protein RGUI_4343 [Rhodovulum sp. P5]
MYVKIVLASLTLCLAALPAAAQSDRTVALVVSVAGGTQRADEIQTQLQRMGAETLRADLPTNAQLRSILKRFAREATDSRASLVYLDVPMVSFEGRAYVLPDGATLDRPTDLFTQAIPILAFARMAVQAEQGGAVIATRGDLPDELPQGVTGTEKAPAPVAGSAPILIAEGDAFADMRGVIADFAGREEIELGELLGRLAAIGGASVSGIPDRPIRFRERPPAPVQAETPAPVPPAPAEPAPAPAVVPEDTPPPPAAVTETLEELALLEQSLSRSAKRSIQNRLRALGHYKGLVDGIFGPQTRAAIIEFQQSRSEDPTGVLTRRQLLDLSA